MKKSILIISFIWIVLVSLSFSWNYLSLKNEQQTIALETARGFFNQMIITREWNADHGGVYVFVTDNTQPNPYLEDPLRDIEINENLKLTKINPAFMTRQLSEIATKREGVQFHITSLNPIRSENSPTSREAIALRAFENGNKEVSEFIREKDSDQFFYMAPLITQKTCLKCHGKAGYKEGDIRGGISVTLPFTMEIPVMPLTLTYLGIGLAGFLGIIIFGKKLDKAYERIKWQAAYDALTGILNRRSFLEYIDREFRRSKRDKTPLSIIMCDVDNFKSYNDTYGHQKGDECLKAIAQSIKKTVNRPGDFCARYGGEEFIIALSNTPLEGAMNVAEAVRENVQKMKIEHVKSLPLQVATLSLGVATLEDEALISYEELIKQADISLYKAKENGRNRVESFSEIS